jgi:hypothetical protein
MVGAIGAGLSACGGGGGDGQPPPPTLEITAANHDAVSHFAAAGTLALSTALGTAGWNVNAAGRAQPAAWAWRPLKRALTIVVDTGDVPCNFGGTLSLTIDDRDNSGMESAGDVVTMVYKNCKGTASETQNGSVTLTVIESLPTSGSAWVSLAQYSQVTTKHSLTFNGTFRLDGSSPSDVLQNSTLTANGPVVVAVTTHLPFTDTVTLQNGFVVRESEDSSVAPPPGATQFGRTISNAQGRLDSALAGGTVDVSTVADISKYQAEAYPRSGAVQVKGKKGTLMLTALSADSVRLDLDANDDGSIESTTAATWDWLL